MGIMEKKMETTIMGYLGFGFRVRGLGSRGPCWRPKNVLLKNAQCNYKKQMPQAGIREPRTQKMLLACATEKNVKICTISILDPLRLHHGLDGLAGTVHSDNVEAFDALGQRASLVSW